MADKSADPGTLLDVDTLILDYLLYAANSTLLNVARARRSNYLSGTESRQAELLIQMVSSFLAIFRSNHPSAPISSTTSFRLSLLKFTTLFTCRFAPSSSSVSLVDLHLLRRQRRERAHHFVGHDDFLADLDLAAFSASLPLLPSSLRAHRDRLLAAFTPSNDTSPATLPDIHEGYYDAPASLSILDTLPLFMNLCAAQTALHGNNVTERWMRLAACYMASAALEQYLVHGASGLYPMLEAFAYGFDASSTAEAGSEELAVTNMFWGGEDAREVDGWREIRGEHLAALLPPEGVPLETHLSELASKELDLVPFEGEVVEFLGTLLHAQAAPVLVQLEKAGARDAGFAGRYFGQGGLGNSFG
ncbi:hypothetical protein MMC30_003743 [Trapelia coarctata]|nr:hypothetical protein [Trapelia coarctata]